MSYAVAIRQMVELAILRKAIEDALAAGYWIGGCNEDSIKKPTNKFKSIWKWCNQTDQDDLWFYRVGTEVGRAGYEQTVKGFEYVGFARFVYGNDGIDVLSDYSMTLEKQLTGARKLADAIEKGKVEIVMKS